MTNTPRTVEVSSVVLHPAVAREIEAGIERRLAPLAGAMADFSRSMMTGLASIGASIARQGEASRAALDEIDAMSKRIARLETALLGPDIVSPDG